MVSPIQESQYQEYLELDKFPQPHVIMKDILIGKLITRSGLSRNSRFLDIGCGRGRILKMLSDRGFKGVGIDLQEICLEICRKRLAGRDIELKNSLNEIEGTFDLIIMSSVLEHIEDDQGYLQNISKLLNKGGFFLFTVPGDMRLYGKRDVAYGHYRRYEKKELIAKLKSANLEVHTLWSYGVNTISRIYRMIISKDLDRNRSNSKFDNTEKSALESDGFQKIKRMYPVYSRLMFLYKFQLLLLNTNIFRANYAGLFKKI
jgi:SAM-dependent methyltransferase